MPTPASVAGYVVCGSHRTRDKVLGVIGRDRQSYHLAFTEHDLKHQGIYPASADELARCKAIKGARTLPARKVPHLRACW
jgi:hypothetical protein